MKTLLKNGKVWLCRDYFAGAIGFDDKAGKIEFVGSDADAKEVEQEYNEVIDVKGKLILPSFTDGHCHLRKGALVNKELNLRDASSRNDIITGIKKYISENGMEWVEGGYFSDSNFKENIKLDKEFLDEICPDIPILMSRFDIHSAIANSKALELSGIESKKGSFKGDELICDENGRLTGELKESAREYVLRSIPVKSTGAVAEILKEEIGKLHSLGITAVADITLPGDLGVFKYLLEKGELDLNIDSRLPFEEIDNVDEYKSEFRDFRDKMKFRSFKAFYDGSLSSETAYFHKNYKGREHHGSRTEFVDNGDFQKYAVKIDTMGYRMSVHAIGDRAVTELLDFNGFLLKNYGVKDRRFRIEHSQHINESDFKKYKRYDVIASVQPWHLFSDAKTASEKVEDIKSTHAYKKLVDLGVNVCFGTDFPVVGESPFETIYYAMARKAAGFIDGFLPEYNMSLMECLEAYTINNAYASGEEGIRGSIREGKAADITVLDNLFEMSPEEIRNAGVEMTFLNGKRVF